MSARWYFRAIIRRVDQAPLMAVLIHFFGILSGLLLLSAP
jgi:hypothetical protein